MHIYPARLFVAHSSFIVFPLPFLGPLFVHTSHVEPPPHTVSFFIFTSIDLVCLRCALPCFIVPGSAWPLQTLELETSFLLLTSTCVFASLKLCIYLTVCIRFCGSFVQAHDLWWQIFRVNRSLGGGLGIWDPKAAPYCYYAYNGYCILHCKISGNRPYP